MPAGLLAHETHISIHLHAPCRSLPSVVDYYGAFHDEKHVYIVMEHCGGGDLLEKLLRTKRGMSERTVALEVALPCLSVLQCLHELRIIHRWGGGRLHGGAAASSSRQQPAAAGASSQAGAGRTRAVRWPPAAPAPQPAP